MVFLPDDAKAEKKAWTTRLSYEDGLLFRHERIQRQARRLPLR
jgi:hypothetical protein